VTSSAWILSCVSTKSALTEQVFTAFKLRHYRRGSFWHWSFPPPASYQALSLIAGEVCHMMEMLIGTVSSLATLGLIAAIVADTFRWGPDSCLPECEPRSWQRGSLHFRMPRRICSIATTGGDNADFYCWIARCRRRIHVGRVRKREDCVSQPCRYEFCWGRRTSASRATGESSTHQADGFALRIASARDRPPPWWRTLDTIAASRSDPTASRLTEPSASRH